MRWLQQQGGAGDQAGRVAGPGVRGCGSGETAAEVQAGCERADDRELPAAAVSLRWHGGRLRCQSAQQPAAATMVYATARRVGE